MTSRIAASAALILLAIRPAVQAQAPSPLAPEAVAALPGLIEALPPYSEAFPRVYITSLSASGEIAAGVAMAEDLPGADWPPPAVVPVVWTSGEGYRAVPVPEAPGQVLYAAETAISPDGTVVVGSLYFANTDPFVGMLPSRAFEWHEEGFAWLPTPEGAASQAYAASGDGSIVLGRINPPAPEADRDVLWRDGKEAEAISPVAGHDRTRAKAISADGGVVVGTSFPGRSGFERSAFRWTPEAGSQPIPGLEEYSTSEALAVSADGRVVVGYAYDGPLSELVNAEAFRWSEADGLQLLGLWTARAVSADGSTVAGTYRLASAVIWTEASGAQYARNVLGADDWWLMYIDDVSADGTVVLGRGEAPGERETVWRGRVPAE